MTGATVAEGLSRAVAGTGPAFTAFLIPHVLAGMTATLSGAVALIARPGSRWRAGAATAYFLALVLLVITATGLTAIRGSRDLGVLLLGGLALTLAAAGRGTEPDAVALGGSYTALVTAFLVDNGTFLPPVVRLLLPSAIAAPLLARCSRRAVRPGGSMNLALRNILFTVVVPGAGGAYVPWLILTRHGALPAPGAWYAAPVIAAGLALYTSCALVFAVAGRGTPGLWDAPRRLVAAGPYRWVRNPIYLAALLIVAGEAWLFLSPALLLYAAGLVAACHLFVIGYEEPHLRARFGEQYEEYQGTVSRWIPHPPRPALRTP